MSEDQRDEMKMIAKNSGISIGLGITLTVFVFFGGLKLGQVQEQLRDIKEEQTLHVPKTESNLEFRNIQRQLDEIKDTQAEILKKLDE